MSHKLWLFLLQKIVVEDICLKSSKYMHLDLCHQEFYRLYLSILSQEESFLCYRNHNINKILSF